MYVDYGVAGEPWHERLIVALGDGERVYVLTPDADVFPEDIGSLRNFVVRPIRRLPGELGAAHGQPVYRFGQLPTPAQVSAAEKEAFDLEASFKNPAEEEPVVAMPGDPNDEGEGDARLPLDVSPVEIDWGETDDSWMALDDVFKYRIKAGDIVDLRGKSGFRGRLYGVAAFDQTTELPVKRVAHGENDAVMQGVREAWREAPPTPRAADNEDIRTLPSRIEGGERRRDFADCVRLFFEEELEFPTDWPSEHPRTTYWWCKSLKRANLTPLTHHSSWLQKSGIDAKERVRHEHEQLCEALEALSTIDQLNLPNLYGVEVLICRLQFLEDAYATGGAPDFTAADEWNPSGRRRGGVLVDPKMQSFVAKKQGEKNVIAKERRRAEEYRKFVPNASKKAKGQGKGKDHKEDGV